MTAHPPTQRVALAYLAAFAGVCGHASSEFFVKLSGLGGAEISVWRFMSLTGIALALAFFIFDDRITLTRIAAIIAITGFVLGEIFYEELRALLTRRRNPATSA